MKPIKTTVLEGERLILNGQVFSRFFEMRGNIGILIDSFFPYRHMTKSRLNLVQTCRHTTSFQHWYDIVGHLTMSYRRWNNVACLRGDFKMIVLNKVDLILLLFNFRSSHPVVFLGKGVLEIYCKFTGEHPKLQLYWKQKATLLKSHIGIGVLLQVFCTFSEHLFLITPLDGCFCNMKKWTMLNVLHTAPIKKMKIFSKIIRHHCLVLAIICFIILKSTLKWSCISALKSDSHLPTKICVVCFI